MLRIFYLYVTYKGDNRLYKQDWLISKIKATSSLS
jgi:hypothetical protein